MIRLIQRRLIIPRGDTGSFSIPALKSSTDNIAVFTIFDELTHTKMFQKTVSTEGDVITIAFTHSDTVNLKPGKYVWDVKYYSNPEYIDDELVNGEEIDSYYAGFSLPVCEIKETADNYLVSPDAPTATLSPQQLEIVTGAIHSLNEAIRKTQENAEHYPEIRNDIWYVWDSELNDYISTHVRAKGTAGNGIASAVLNDDYTLTLNFTDDTSFTSPSIRGQRGNGIEDIVLNNDFSLTITYTDGDSYVTPSIRGPVGATPQMDIGTVQTLPAGSSATASMSGTAENPLLNLSIPKGDKGDAGEKGEKGDKGDTYVVTPENIEEISTRVVQSATIAQYTEGMADQVEAAQQHASDAGDSATAADSSKKAAAQSAQAASQSASAADTSARNAAHSEINAENSASAASQSAQAASQSATNAATSERNAADSAQDAQDVLDSIPADYSALTNEVTGLKSAFNRGVYDGEYDLQSSDFVQGAWANTAPSDVHDSGSRNIRPSVRFTINPGDAIITKPGQTDLYIRWTLFDSADAIVEEYKGYYDKNKIIDRTHVFEHSGTLNITVANGHNYGNSTNIVPSDMTATIIVQNSYAARVKSELSAEIESKGVLIEENSDEIESLINESRQLQLSETPYAEATSFLPYAMDFIPGQTYIVKLKFTEFGSVANRKYSLRTTTMKYSSSPYFVQFIARVDGQNPDVGKEYTYTFKAVARPDGGIGHYILVELNPSAGYVASCELKVYSIKVEDAQTDLQKLDYLTATDIVSLNHDVTEKILNGSKPFNRATTKPFALLHFSDIHANGDNLARMVDMKKHLGANVDDTICTGDMVANNYSATSMDFWNAVDGAENILMVVGNHDLADGQHGYSSDQIGQTVAYQTYFSPYVANWGVTMAGENLTYWYKDYTAKNVRLIGLNYLLTGEASAAQKTWLAARLAEAKTAGLTVVIAEHSPLNSFTEVDCNFNIIGKPWGYTEILADIQSAVQDFIDDGGEFACYIAGHSHSDYVGYNSNYPQQLCIVVTTALTTGNDNDQWRAIGTKSQDAANVVLVDTVTKTVKLIRVGADMDTYLRGRHLFSIRYTDKQIISQS